MRPRVEFKLTSYLNRNFCFGCSYRFRQIDDTLAEEMGEISERVGIFVVGGCEVEKLGG